MERYLQNELLKHFSDNRQMVLLSGPRQVGKTTLARELARSFKSSEYFNWDNQNQRELILRGQEAVASAAGLDRLQADVPFAAFDELHKYSRWRDFLKGFFDVYESRVKILVTGSASLETLKRGGDSLMGRYFPYTLHPVSVAECTALEPVSLINGAPQPIDNDQWEALQKFSGYPEPFLKADQRFYNRWRTMRTEQLFREDLRDLTRIQELDQVEILARLLSLQVGQLTSYSSLARNTRVAVDTIRRWLETLEALYFCFKVPPWHHNVARALRKESKYFLWDWSQVQDPGGRAENIVASALLKAVHWWTETGRGNFALYFVRDKQKREVDFLVSRDEEPWFLVEVKSSQKAGLSSSLAYFQKQTGAEHAFQVAMDADFVEADCFEHRDPIIVPARTFLAQLV